MNFNKILFSQFKPLKLDRFFNLIKYKRVFSLLLVANTTRFRPNYDDQYCLKRLEQSLTWIDVSTQQYGVL